MYLSSIVVLGVFGAIGVLGAGLECQNFHQSNTPAATPVLSLDLDSSDFSYGGAPRPTEPPNVPFGELIKRQQGPTTICGIFATNSSWSYTCNDAWVCGFATADRNAFGCCSSYLGNGSVTDCFLPTACYDSTAANSISCGVNDEQCNWSSLYCTSSQYPYCGSYIENGLTAFDCFRTRSESYNLVAYSGPAATITSTSSSQSNSVSKSSTTSSFSFSSSSGLGSGVPFSQQQQSVGGANSGSSVPPSRTSSGLAPALATNGEQWYGFVMSFFLLFL